MDFRSLVDRAPPTAWEGRLPWDEPAFSARMLGEHLSQTHDLASRRFERIDEHVGWLDQLVGRPGRVLDLACGPGLYSARLAALGHRCVGIDMAPAAIEFAEAHAQRHGLDCEYRLADLAEGFDDTGFDLVLFLYGDLDTIPPESAETILRCMTAALAPGGRAVIEAHSAGVVRRMGDAPPTWRALSGGLFSDRTHLLLEEASWDDAAQGAVRRFWVAEEHATSWYSVTTQARDYPSLIATLEPSAVVSTHPRGAAPWVDEGFEVILVEIP